MADKVFLFLGVMVLSRTAVGQGEPNVKVVLREDDDAVLPCSISPIQNLETKLFDWIKDGEKEVFQYSNGSLYGKGLYGQDSQFTGRVSHFPEQLKDGNASIKIQRTTLSDSGIYTCMLTDDNMQTFAIELLVECILKDRTKEKKDGACPKPSINVNQTRDLSVLQCEIEGAFPKPDIKWQDSAGTVLPAVIIKSTEKEGHFYITLQTNVSQSGVYRCVVTQLEICHQIQRETELHISGKADESLLIPVITGCIGMVLGASVVGIPWLYLTIKHRRRRSAGAEYGLPLETANGSAPHGSYPTAEPPELERLHRISDV